MRLGIFAKTFPGTDAASVLAAVSRAGYSCTQFNMACCGLPAMPDMVSPTIVAAVRAAAQDSGVTLSALSATYNMIHPDRVVRDQGMRRLRVALAVARSLGIPLVTLCTGTRDPDDQWRHHVDNSRPEAWFDLTREMEYALILAEAMGVDLGIEPEQANVVTSAAEAVKLIGDMGSKRLKVVLDPANLFDTATPDEARGIVADAVERVAGTLAMAHAKDRTSDGRFVTPGRGIIDFAEFRNRLQAVGFDGPVVTHGLRAEDAAEVAAYLSGLGLT